MNKENRIETVEINCIIAAGSYCYDRALFDRLNEKLYILTNDQGFKTYEEYEKCDYEFKEFIKMFNLEGNE